MLTGLDGAQLTSIFDDHSDRPEDAIRLVFSEENPARMDREALDQDPWEVFDYPSGLFSDSIRFAELDDQ